MKLFGVFENILCSALAACFHRQEAKAKKLAGITPPMVAYLPVVKTLNRFDLQQYMVQSTAVKQISAVWIVD